MATSPKMQFIYILSIPIQAPKEKLWAILADLEEYPKWNSVVTHVQGKLLEGNAIKLKLRFQSGKPKPAVCQVKKIESGSYFLLTQTILGSGFLHMEHYFMLEETIPGTVIFTQKWEMYGLMARLFKHPLSKSLRSFERMNKELKALAEQKKEAAQLMA